MPVSSPIYMRYDVPVSESARERAALSPRGGAAVDMQQLSPGLNLIRSELSFARETELREEYPESEVFQLSFCLGGGMEWRYGPGTARYEIAPTQCSLQFGRFTRCDSYYSPGEACRTLGVVMDRRRFPELTAQLEAERLIRPGQGIRSRVFPTTAEMRRVLAQIVDCPAERTLRRLYLEGKVFELLSLFCEAAAEKRGESPLSRGDGLCLKSAREYIDKNFLHPLTIPQIARRCCLSETKLKQGFKACFNCTVYEYIVEKRMELAHRLLQSGKYKVKDVVWMVGYSNTSHFIEAFKKRYGVTPGEV